MRPARKTRLAIVTVLSLGVALSLWLLASAGIIPQSFRELRWSVLRRSPAGEPAFDVSDKSFVTLRRTGCLGNCPIYGVTVFGSGRVEFVGKAYVCDVGRRTATIDPRRAAKLISDLESAGYFEIDWQAGDWWSDFPSANTCLSTRGRARSIHDDHGEQGVPRLMRRFEDAIDDVAGTERWLPQGEGSKLFCVAHDGTRREAPM